MIAAPPPLRAPSPADEPARWGFEGLAIMGGSRLIAAMLGLAAATLVARHLTPAELGVWAMALAVQGYALHLGEFGLRSVATAEASATEGGPFALLERYLRLRLVLSAIVVLLVVAVSALLVPDHLGLIALASLSIIAIALMVDWVPLVEGRHKTASLLLLTRPLLFCSGLLLLPGASTPEQVAVIFLLSWIGAAIATWLVLARHRAGGVRRATSPLDDRRMLRLGWPLMGVTLTNQVLMSADLLIVGLVVGTAAAGQYYLAGAVSVAGLVFANAAGQLSLARLGRWRRDPKAWHRALAQDLKKSMVAALIAGTGLALIAPNLMPLAFGEAYRSAASLLPWFVPWLVLQHASAVLQAAITTTQRRRALLEANLFALLILAIGIAGLMLVGLHAFSVTTALAALALTRAAAEGAKIALLLDDVGRMGDRTEARNSGAGGTQYQEQS